MLLGIVKSYSEWNSVYLIKKKIIKILRNCKESGSTAFELWNSPCPSPTSYHSSMEKSSSGDRTST